MPSDREKPMIAAYPTGGAMKTRKHATLLLGSLAALVSAKDVGAQPDATGASNIANQFTISLPQGWSVYDQNAAVFDRDDGFGVVVFSAQPVTKPDQAIADPELIAKVDSGENPSFFVDRKPADKNATCAKLSRPTLYDVGTKIAQDPALGGARRAFSAGLQPRSTDIELGGCKGARFLLDGPKSDGDDQWIIDVRVVSDGKVLYLFSLRSRARFYRHNLPLFEGALATVKFTQ
jgi:hypothetical protein